MPPLIITLVFTPRNKVQQHKVAHANIKSLRNIFGFLVEIVEDNVDILLIS